MRALDIDPFGKFGTVLLRENRFCLFVRHSRNIIYKYQICS